MSRGFNNAVVFGGLARDPNVKYGQSGNAFIVFTIAAGYAVRNQDGEYEERTDWVPCKAFGKNAENIGKYCKKGDRLLIQGKIRTETYEKDGQKTWSTMLYADSVIFGGKANGGGGDNATQSGDNYSAGTATNNAQSSRPPKPISEHEQSKANGYQKQSNNWDFGEDPGYPDSNTADIPF